MKELFGIENYNVIEDEENYYFFRSLEPGDIEDLDAETIQDDEGKYIRLRTDRERWEETNKGKNPRWTEKDEISLEQLYHHIKYNYSLQTNCISLTSSAAVAKMYGDQFSQRYVMITVPKKEMGEQKEKIIKMQSEDRKKAEMKKKEKYKTDNLFNNRKDKESLLSDKKNNIKLENTELIEIKEKTILQKILQKIKIVLFKK